MVEKVNKNILEFFSPEKKETLQQLCILAVRRRVMRIHEKDILTNEDKNCFPGDTHIYAVISVRLIFPRESITK